MKLRVQRRNHKRSEKNSKKICEIEIKHNFYPFNHKSSYYLWISEQCCMLRVETFPHTFYVSETFGFYETPKTFSMCNALLILIWLIHKPLVPLTKSHIPFKKKTFRHCEGPLAPFSQTNDKINAKPENGSQFIQTSLFLAVWHYRQIGISIYSRLVKRIHK